jgi:hypothetical protein
MEDVNISKFRAQVVRSGSTPASPGFVVSEGQNPVDPSGSGQNHLPVTIATASTGLSITESQVLGGAGTVGQYIRGDGSLADFPATTGGGSSVSYYLNGSVSQGTIGGVAYREVNRTPIFGAGTDITTSSNGYIANFITDAGDPNKLLIPAGNWNLETYFSANNGGGSPTFYVELYKYNGTTFTLIATSSGTPELIAFGTNINPYFTTLAVPETVLALTDRLALRYYVNTSGRTITLHTEDNHLCQVITTFTTGLTALNGLTSQVQFFAVGTSGTDFAISSATDTHTFNLPTASATNRGALSSADWTTFNGKQNALTNPVTGTGTSGTLPKFTGSTTIGNSLFTDNGTNGAFGGANYYSGTDLRTFNISAPLYAGLSFWANNQSVGNIVGFGVTGNLTLNADQSNLFANSKIILSIDDTERFAVFSNGNVTIANSPTDAGYKLDVNGTGRFSSDLTANSFVKISGTSSQFLKADGSVDSTTYVPTSRTITINGTSQDLSANRTYNVGTVTSITATAGTGISISGSPITSSGTLTITNTAPDQVVSLTASTGISITGTYPNFTITNTSPASGSGITGTGITGRLPIFTGTNTISSSNINGASSTIYNENPIAGQYAWSFQGSTTTGQSYGASVIAGTNSSDIGFKVMNSAATINYFVVRGDGNVGIGTGSPTNPLHIQSNTLSQLNVTALSGNTNAQINLEPTGTGIALIGPANNVAFAFRTNATERMRITSGGNLEIYSAAELRVYRSDNARYGTFYCNNSAAIVEASTDPLRLSGPDRIEFYPGGTEKMRISSAGVVTITNLGTGTVTSTAGVLSAVSDSSLKVHDGFIDSAIDKVLSLKPRYFYWNEKSGLPTDIRQLGFYAQEVNHALGEEAANTPRDKNIPWGITDRSIIAMLTKAIQELKQEIDTLKNKKNETN